jgi:toxin HigB-1
VEAFKYMIRSFRDRKTEDFSGGDNVRQFSGFKKVAQRKLVILGSAVKLGDLAACPGNRLEKLLGDRPDSTASGSMISGGSVLWER